MDVQKREKGNYGIDALGVVRNLFIVGVIVLSLGIGCFYFLRDSLQWLGWTIGIIFVISFLICLVEAIYMLWSSKIGKLRVREQLADLVDIQGNENVLDIGFGRGLVLIAAAQRLTTGRVVGINIWNQRVQSGNHNRKNAELEGVIEKIKLVNGDARHLPFENDSFDVVVSSLAIHNIKYPEERIKALYEAMRVLKPNGRIAILDFQHVKEYAHVFEEIGLVNLEITCFQYLMFPPVRIVIGSKPF